MSLMFYVVVLALFFVLGALETLVPRTMDGLMSRLLGRAYGRAASEGSRLRWIRLNGILLLALCVLMSFTLAGR